MVRDSSLTSRCPSRSIRTRVTTLTLDEDVAAKLKAETRKSGRHFKQSIKTTPAPPRNWSPRRLSSPNPDADACRIPAEASDLWRSQ